jgi:hypothetical protein
MNERMYSSNDFLLIKRTPLRLPGLTIWTDSISSVMQARKSSDTDKLEMELPSCSLSHSGSTNRLLIHTLKHGFYNGVIDLEKKVDVNDIGDFANVR